jgi:hypothetical protein
VSVRRASLLLATGVALAVALLPAGCGGGSASAPATTTTATGSGAASGAAPATKGQEGMGGGNSASAYGPEASSTQRRLAEGALSAYLAAKAREDWPAACSYLSGPLRRHFEEFARAAGSKLKGCAPILELSSGSGPGPAGPPAHGLSSLRVKGESALALWVGPHGQGYAMPMLREGGAWRLAQIAPLPDPPGSAP